MASGFTALVHLPLAEVTAISFARTLFTTLLAIIFLQEVVGIRRWAVTIVGFIGVLIMLSPSGNVNMSGAMLAICASDGVYSGNGGCSSKKFFFGSALKTQM